MLLALTLGTFAFSEIMYDWPGTDAGTGFSHEWVEVVNCSGGTVEITDDFRFFEGSNHLIADPIKGSRSVPTGGVFVLASDAKTATATFFVDYASFSGTVFDTVMSLNNTTDTLELRGEAGTVLASVTYQSSWGGQGNGKSIEKENPCDGNPNGGWRESSAVGGTPGLAVVQASVASSPSPSPSATPSSPSQTPTLTPSPSPSPTPAPVVYPAQTMPTPSPSVSPVITSPGPSPAESPSVIPSLTPSPSPQAPAASFGSPVGANLSVPPILNEIVPSPTGPDTQNEFIEILNPNDTALNASGWFLDDGEGGSTPYQLPAGTLIEPRGVLVFSSAATKIALNNDGDTVRLLGSGKSVVESVTYGKAEEGRAYARDDVGAWRWSTLPTPGSQNVFAEKQTTEIKKSKTAAPQNTPVAEKVGASEPSPTPFALDLTKLPPRESLSARIVSSDARSFVLAGSIAVSLSLLLVAARRFF